MFRNIYVIVYNMKWVIKKNKNVLNHLLFWSGIWLLYIFFFSYNSNDLNHILSFSTILLPITAIATYVMVYVLIPKYLRPKKYLQFSIYTFTTLLFTTFSIVLFLIMSVAYSNKLQFKDLPSISINYIFIVILVYLIVAVVSFASLWRKSTQTAIKNRELKNQLLTTKFRSKEQELKYLKNQIHPHFLFNTLNTIYGLALKKSPEVPDIILKLSNLLDYILYQASKPEVPLIDEITHLEQYIDLEKIRFNDTLKVTFTKEIANEDIFVAPLLLLPFVENAFKHGNIIDGFLNVTIHISVNDNELHFSIKNTFNENISKEGLGLINLKDRLDILYPENYDLQIDTKPPWFELSLKIKDIKQNLYA